PILFTRRGAGIASLYWTRVCAEKSAQKETSRLTGNTYYSTALFSGQALFLQICKQFAAKQAEQKWNRAHAQVLCASTTCGGRRFLL
ncbi:MAG: hypothetical protein J5967_01530, partial [Oscillospiraceae bacterium]|nr:hypothetical protein [Oscillospiraceae bacterium]